MKRLNKRGEVTLALLGIVAVALAVTALVPKLNPFNGVLGAPSTIDASKQKASWTRQTETRQPVVLLDKRGEAVAVGEKTELVYDTGAEEKPPKLTYGERIGQFFARLTTWGLVFVGVLFFGFGITPWMVLGWFRGRARRALDNERAEKEKNRNALKNTVAALRELPPEVWDKIRPILAEYHDKQDKVLIDSVKADLH